MKNTSRPLFLALAMMATAALATTSAHAVGTTVKVPFDFTVAGKTMPAGQYVVERDQRFGTVTLRCKDTTKSFTWLTGPGEVDPTGSHVVVQFDQLGSIHVLRAIHYGSESTSRLDKISYGASEPETGR